jgi:hypothetical protein
VRLEAFERACLVVPHEAGVADHVGGKDSGKSALQAFSPSSNRLALREGRIYRAGAFGATALPQIANLLAGMSPFPLGVSGVPSAAVVGEAGAIRVKVLRVLGCLPRKDAAAGWGGGRPRSLRGGNRGKVRLGAAAGYGDSSAGGRDSVRAIG